jgi:hypothetical protein
VWFAVQGIEIWIRAMHQRAAGKSGLFNHRRSKSYHRKLKSESAKKSSQKEEITFTKRSFKSSFFIPHFFKYVQRALSLSR